MKSWVKWSGGEGVIRTFNGSVQKFLGEFSKTVPGLLLTTLIANGIVTLVVGLIGAKARKQKILAARDQILGSLSIGTVAMAMQFLTLTAYTYEGNDMGIITFIIALSIIPGAVFDWIFFSNLLSPRQFLGVAVYLLAGWSVLSFPKVELFLDLPVWVLISCIIATLFAINEAITRKIREVDSFVNLFWVGFITIVWCSILITGFGGWKVMEILPFLFWPCSIILGLNTVGVLSSRLMAYKGGGTIAKRKIVMKGTNLSLAMLAGVIIYGEPLTMGKVSGLILFFIAFLLIDQETWENIRKRF